MFPENLTSVSNFISLLASGEGQVENSLGPLYDAITLIGPYAIGIAVMLCMFYGIIVGVRFARAEKSEERAALQKVLINGIIGFVAVIILISILYAIREPLARWMNG